MGLISCDSLKTFTKYYENKLKLKVIHFCPIDGHESDTKCKRIVVTSDVSQQTQTHQPIERYLVIVFFGCYANTPFKKTALRSGQLFTLHRFETSVLPKNKVFKSGGHILKDFYEPLVLVKPEFEPIIKMLVSLREDNSFVAIQGMDSVEDNPIEATNSNPMEGNSSERVAKNESNEPKVQKHVRSPAKKRLKFDSTDEELDIHLSSDEDFNTNSRRTLKSSSNKQTNRESIDRNNIKINVCHKKHNKNNIMNDCNKSAANCGNNSVQNNRKHEYKTLIEVHNLMPVSGKTYCHIYGILRHRDFKQNTIQLRDEKAFTFTIHLKPGNSSFRNYPPFRPGDLIRIHRILLAPNSMEIICTDPKDVVVFEAFQDLDSFSPINTSLNPTFEDFDKHRKQEMDEWFSDQLLSDSLSQKKASSYSVYTDLAVQVLKVSTNRDRSYLEVWDTTKPSLKTFKSQISTNGFTIDRSEEELIRIINENEMSIVVTVFEQHSNDALSLKPFDFIVLFNVNIRTDRFNQNCFTYNLNSGYQFGKCIRFVKQNSSLGKKLFARIEEYKVMSAVNVSNHSNECFPSQSQPIDITNDEIEREIAISAHEESVVFSEMENFDIDINEVVDVLEREESYLPVVHNFVDIPDNNISIDELLSKGVDKQLYKVKARVIRFLKPTEKIDVISVLCTNQECNQIKSLRQTISNDPLIETIIESSKDKKLILNCVKCKQSSCVLVFKLLLILEDNKHNKMIGQLFGHNAELFLMTTPEEVLQMDSKWSYVERVLKYICAQITPIDSNQSNNLLLNWIIQLSKHEDREEYIYQIRTAIPIDTVDKCVGLNLN